MQALGLLYHVAHELCAKRNITCHESQLILHRLMQFGFFEHVVGEHGFIDGNFFYRLTDSQP